jgi:hypothetical protein
VRADFSRLPSIKQPVPSRHSDPVPGGRRTAYCRARLLKNNQSRPVADTDSCPQWSEDVGHWTLDIGLKWMCPVPLFPPRPVRWERVQGEGAPSVPSFQSRPVPSRIPSRPVIPIPSQAGEEPLTAVRGSLKQLVPSRAPRLLPPSPLAGEGTGVRGCLQSRPVSRSLGE